MVILENRLTIYLAVLGSRYNPKWETKEPEITKLEIGKSKAQNTQKPSLT